MKEMKKISLVVPCYNEQENIVVFFQRIAQVCSSLKDYDYEVLYVDDGSTDHTLAEIKKLAEGCDKVKYISFSRNFGKEAALYAGLQKASGDYAAVMDVDLQDPPELLPEMAKLLDAGNCQCVAARRVDRRGEGLIRSFFSRKFYQIFRILTRVQIPDGARDFRMMNRTFLEGFLKLKEYNRFSKGLFDWVGYSVIWLEYENQERTQGKTKWSFWKLLAYSLDGIFSFSNVPAVIAGGIGTLFCFLAFLFLIIIFARALLFGDPVAGWPSTICIILMIGGIQLFCLGILGQYLAKTYAEVKERPIYLCKETNIDSEQEEKA